jgi:hypothetical protein
MSKLKFAHIFDHFKMLFQSLIQREQSFCARCKNSGFLENFEFNLSKELL